MALAVCAVLLPLTAVPSSGSPAPPRSPAAAAARSVVSSANGMGGAATGMESGAAGYRLPLAGTVAVLTRFQPPPTPYAAGHRGVDLAASSGRTVVAAGGGVVRYAGVVAGRGVVVIAHPDGISTEYEPVSSSVRAGQPVASGQRIGTLTGRHAACLPASCLHWGARRGGDYLDPLSLLRPLGVVRLVP